MDEHTQKMLRELEEIYALVEEGKMTITRMDKSTTMYGPDEITMTIQVRQGVTNLGKTLIPNPNQAASHSHTVPSHTVPSHVHTVTASSDTKGIHNSNISSIAYIDASTVTDAKISMDSIDTDGLAKEIRRQMSEYLSTPLVPAMPTHITGVTA